MTTNTATITQECATRVINTLTRLGYTHKGEDGITRTVVFKSLEYVGDKFALIEVDVQRLPRRVRVEDLANEHTLHELTASVGKRVYKLNTTGLTYCIPLQTVKKIKLPERVALPMEERPTKTPTIPLGFTAQGNRIASLSQAGHILVGGTTRAGKSNWLTCAVTWLFANRKPEDIQLAIVDSKGVEFVAWANAPHLIAPIASEVDTAEKIMVQVCNLISQRGASFATVGARTLDEYNTRSDTKLPRLVLIVDEFTDLVLSAGSKSPLASNLARIVSKGAAFGVTAILATQHPKSEVINTLIRANLTTRIAFRCNEPDQSRVIIGDARAAKLPPIAGRAYVRIGDTCFVTQTFYLDPDKADEIARATSTPTAKQSTINEDTARLVRYALVHFSGAFTVSKLANVFDAPEDGGIKITRWTIQKTAEQLEANGLLTKPATVTDSRKVTPALAKLADIAALGGQN